MPTFSYTHTNPSSEHHESCRRWVETAFNSPVPIGIPWLTVWAFLRISTNHRAFEKPLSMKEASKIVASWFDASAARRVEPGERHWEILNQLLVEGQIIGPLVTDAAMAAIAIENGASMSG